VPSRAGEPGFVGPPVHGRPDPRLPTPARSGSLLSGGSLRDFGFRLSRSRRARSSSMRSRTQRASARCDPGSRDSPRVRRLSRIFPCRERGGKPPARCPAGATTHRRAATCPRRSELPRITRGPSSALSRALSSSSTPQGAALGRSRARRLQSSSAGRAGAGCRLRTARAASESGSCIGGVSSDMERSALRGVHPPRVIRSLSVSRGLAHGRNGRSAGSGRRPVAAAAPLPPTPIPSRS